MNTTPIKYDQLSIIPLGGQSEIGQVLWVFSYGGELLLVDAGASYPREDLPGVDLLLPSTSFLEANQEHISALLLTNGHEEHTGAIAHLLNHLKIPRIMAPSFLSALISQKLLNQNNDTIIDTIKTRHPYQLGHFLVEWIQVNDAIADACALSINTPEGNVIYTSSFKLDQTPVDNRLLDSAYLASAGDSGVLLLISNSAGVESPGYTPSEKSIAPNLERELKAAPGRVIIILPGTNTHRLQLIFDLASALGRKVIVHGEALIQTTLAAVVTGHLFYDRKIEAAMSDLEKLPDQAVLMLATGQASDPMDFLHDLAYKKLPWFSLKNTDTVIYSADIDPGNSRRMAMILDELLSAGVKVIHGTSDGVHTSRYASQEELKLMLTLTRPKYFVPCLGEGRHIIHHAQLAINWGMPANCVFPLHNGEILEIEGHNAKIAGNIDSKPVLYNRYQGEIVATFSVKERRALSTDGSLTIGCALDAKGQLISGPIIEAGASGFLKSHDWISIQEEIKTAITDLIANFSYDDQNNINPLRSAIRELASKMIRSRLQAKPVLHVVVQSVTNYPG